MSTTTENTETVGTAPNAGLIDDLRHVADWLEKHPEIPAGHAFVWLGNDYNYGTARLENERADMVRFAIAADNAGWEAKERTQGNSVQLVASVSSKIDVQLSVDLDRMDAVHPEPVYAKVLKDCPHCGGKGATPDDAGENCVTCDGRGYLVPDPPLDICEEDFAPRSDMAEDPGDIPW